MNHYEILGLQATRGPQTAITQQDLKRAYRIALLKYHPDKAKAIDGTVTKTEHLQSSTQTFPDRGNAEPSIDQITLAYRTLLNTETKSDYDRTLLLDRRQDKKDPKFHTGLDTADLDDLAFDDAAQIWYRPCRCGQERGYVITEQQLEQVADSGEIIIGCRGCSLWLKVLFAVDDGEG